VAEGVIGKANLGKLVAAVSKAARFFGPVRGGAVVSLAEVGADGKMDFGYAELKLPLKRHFFPRCEVLYTYDREGGSDAPLPGEKTVVFGARPCDAAALLHTDKVFLGQDYTDPYYRQRRENSVVITLACAQPAATCFCTSVGSGPAGKDGADVLAFDLGESLLFESLSEKGAEFMKAHASLFAEPGPEQTKAREKQAAEAEKKVAQVDVSGIAEKLKAAYDSPVWAQITERCLSCGICTSLCPTCHCFGIYDEKGEAGGRRIRVQDACMFPGFTLEASGHNPRTARGNRMRQRVMHKFRYTVENFGDIFCVGCGRCIANCPVNMDVRETLSTPAT